MLTAFDTFSVDKFRLLNPSISLENLDASCAFCSCFSSRLGVLSARDDALSAISKSFSLTMSVWISIFETSSLISVISSESACSAACKSGSASVKSPPSGAGFDGDESGSGITSLSVLPSLVPTVQDED